MTSRFASWLAGLLAAAFGFATLVLGVIFVPLVRLPFNAQGRYFDEGVVHNEQVVPVYGLLVLLFSAMALFGIGLFRRFLRDARAADGQGGPGVMDGIAAGEKAIAEDKVATQAEARTRLARWRK